MSVWFITGASRGFGRLLTAAALAEGDRVIAAARNPQVVRDAFPDDADSLSAVPLDVNDPRQAVEAVASGVEHFGRIDVLVNNAGYGLFGAIEEISDAQARALFDTNVFGLLNVTRAALPTLRSQGAGRILNMGSSAGIGVGAGRGLYGASKFAVEAVTEALHAELAPLGIHVTVVEPGSFRTDFLTTDSKRAAAVGISDYADTVGSLLTAIDANDGRQPGDPASAVAAIRTIAAITDPPLRLPLGSDCVRLIEGKIESLTTELDRWRNLASATDFPPG